MKYDHIVGFLDLLSSESHPIIIIYLLSYPCQAFFSHVFFPITTQTLVRVLSAGSSLLPAYPWIDFASSTVPHSTWLRVSYSWDLTSRRSQPPFTSRRVSSLSPRFLRPLWFSTFSMLKVNMATSLRRLYSTILAEFSWYSEALVLKPESTLAHSDKLPAFEASSSFLLCIQTMNNYSYLRCMASRTLYSISSVIHPWRIFWGCWAWMSSQPRCQSRAVTL